MAATCKTTDSQSVMPAGVNPVHAVTPRSKKSCVSDALLETSIHQLMRDTQPASNSVAESREPCPNCFCNHFSYTRDHCRRGETLAGWAKEKAGVGS